MVAYILSKIFHIVDVKLDESDLNKGTYDTLKIIEVFTQLFLTAVAYFYIEKLVFKIPSIASYIKSNYRTYKTANYSIHIVMIITIIEMNSSLVHNLHYMSQIIG